MNKSDYLPKNLKLNWLKATCPICGRDPEKERRIMLDIVFKRNARPGKRLKLCSYCLSCTRRIPPDKDFCDNDICENAFYDDSHLEREEDEALAEQREMEREERKCKSIP